MSTNTSDYLYNKIWAYIPTNTSDYLYNNFCAYVDKHQWLPL